MEDSFIYRNLDTTIQAWRDGNYLVLPRDNAVGPSRCIFTNQEIFEHNKIIRRLTWADDGSNYTPTWIRILIALASMDAVTVKVGVSVLVQTRRIAIMALCILGLCVGMTLFVRGLTEGSVPPPMLPLATGSILIILSISFFANTYAIVDIVKLTDSHVWLRGPKRPFLESLDVWPSDY